MDDTEVAANVAVAEIGALKLAVFFVCEIGHGALEFADDVAGGEGAGGEYT